MIYLKSFLAGLLALAVLIVAGLGFASMEIMTRRLASQDGMGSFVVDVPWISLWSTAAIAPSTS